MTTFIIIVVAFVIGKFIYDKSQTNIKIGKEGGMRQKYKELIANLLTSDKNAKIIKESNDTIIIGVASTGGITNFSLIQTFSELTIQWRMESPIYGKHNLEWSFPEYGDQNKMLERINSDLGKYQTNVIQSSPFKF
jgi:hypothetical protein